MRRITVLTKHFSGLKYSIELAIANVVVRPATFCFNASLLSSVNALPYAWFESIVLERLKGK